MSKIYQIISSIQLGGAELVAFNLARFVENIWEMELSWNLLKFIQLTVVMHRVKRRNLNLII